MAGRHSNPVGPSIAKLEEAWAMGFTRDEIISELRITPVWYDQCADRRMGVPLPEKGLSPEHVRQLDRMVRTKKASQPRLNLEYEPPIEIPGTEFDLSVFKKKTEEVWMVEIKRKSSGNSHGVAIPLGDGTTFIVDPTPKV
jgi:hypothetical protein